MNDRDRPLASPTRGSHKTTLLGLGICLVALVPLGLMFLPGAADAPQTASAHSPSDRADPPQVAPRRTGLGVATQEPARASLPVSPAESDSPTARALRADSLGKEGVWNLRSLNWALREYELPPIAPDALLDEDQLRLVDEAWEAAITRVNTAHEAWEAAAEPSLEAQRAGIREAIARGEEPDPYLYQVGQPRESVRFEISGEVLPSNRDRAYPIRVAPIGEFTRFAIDLENSHRILAEVVDKTIRPMFRAPPPR